MSEWHLAKAVFVSTVCLSACSTSTQAPSSKSAEDRVVIQSGGRLFTSAEPAELKASLGATPIVELAVRGASAGEVWAVNARFADAQVRRPQAVVGELSATLSRGAIADGRAQLTLGSQQGASQTASGGTLQVKIANGRITGEVKAEPLELAASIEGDIVISCWVPREEGTAAGTTDAAKNEVLVEDTDLSSSACAPFKALLPQH